METSNKQGVITTSLNAVKTAGLYSAEKPLLGTAIVLHTTARAIDALAGLCATGASKCHASRKNVDKHTADLAIATAMAKSDAFLDGAMAKILAIGAKKDAAKAAKYEPATANDAIDKFNKAMASAI